MRFSWDAAKSEACYEERGFDFAFAARIFEEPTLERPDDRSDYGERRIVAIGAVEGIELTLVYTDRTEAAGPVRRLISARRSNRRERKAYADALKRLPDRGEGPR